MFSVKFGSFIDTKINTNKRLKEIIKLQSIFSHNWWL